MTYTSIYQIIKSKLSNNNGYATVEISILIWVILFIVFTMFYHMSFEFEKVISLANLNNYTVEKANESSKSKSVSIALKPSTIGVISDDSINVTSNVKNKKVAYSVHKMMIIHRQLKNLK